MSLYDTLTSMRQVNLFVSHLRYDISVHALYTVLVGAHTKHLIHATVTLPTEAKYRNNFITQAQLRPRS